MKTPRPTTHSSKISELEEQLAAARSELSELQEELSKKSKETGLVSQEDRDSRAVTGPYHLVKFCWLPEKLLLIEGLRHV